MYTLGRMESNGKFRPPGSREEAELRHRAHSERDGESILIVASGRHPVLALTILRLVKLMRPWCWCTAPASG